MRVITAKIKEFVVGFVWGKIVVYRAFLLHYNLYSRIFIMYISICGMNTNFHYFKFDNVVITNFYICI